MFSQLILITLLVINKVLQWKTKQILTVFKPGKECDKENRLARVVSCHNPVKERYIHFPYKYYNFLFNLHLINKIVKAFHELMIMAQ